MNKQSIEKLAKQCMIALSDEEIKEIILEFEIYKQQLELLNEIDTSAVEPMVYGRQVIINGMRADDVVENLSLAEVFENAPSRVDDFFRVTAVVES